MRFRRDSRIGGVEGREDGRKERRGWFRDEKQPVFQCSALSTVKACHKGQFIDSIYLQTREKEGIVPSDACHGKMCRKRIPVKLLGRGLDNAEQGERDKQAANEKQASANACLTD